LNSQRSHLKILGKRILAEANDLKRTPEALAHDLGYELSVVQSVIDGKADLEVTKTLLTRMCENYPISLADLWVDADDTTEGVKLMRAHDSQSTTRVFSRKDQFGEHTSYYEYRDTVMSQTAPFKPEWIKPMRVVEDSNPENPNVSYNKGHLLHQCTFITGEVNFYWELDGFRYCTELNTGDSNYITPFVPHSFTSRNGDKLGLVIAVTFGAEVRKALNQFIHAGTSRIEAMTDNLSDKIQAFKSRLNRYLNAESLEVQEFINRLANAGIDSGCAAEIANGKKLPSPVQLNTIADVLSLRTEDLSVTPMNTEDAISVQRSKNTDPRYYPSVDDTAYILKELVRTKHNPYLRGFDITVLDKPKHINSWFCHHLHEYIYNFGDTPIQLYWHDNHEETLETGDSAYIQPMIKHCFASRKKHKPGHLVVVRVPGALNDFVINEFSRYPSEARRRVIQETDIWF